MRKMLGALIGVLVVSCFLARLAPAEEEKAKAEAKPAAADEATKAVDKAAPAEGAKDEAPEFIVLDKTGKLAPVKFPHKVHADKLKGCKDCHEGETPLFAKEKGKDGMKMADMRAGKACGACHDGKDHFEVKKVFTVSMCMKCNKKEEVKKEEKK